ncbi:MAG: type II secretion system F family protein [Gammaproteobacteria bacterium]
MPAFRYNGRTTRGEAVAGSLESESAETLATHLFARGITPIDIKPIVVTRDVLGELWQRLGGGRPTITDLILFSRQMYSISKAGVPLLRGMQSIAASTANPVMRATLQGVIESLQGGRDLTFAFGRFPDVFTKFYLSVIKVGESSGTLEKAFLRMYEFLGMQKRVRDKVKAALRYPATVVVAIAIAMGVITMFVLPKFAPIFASLGDNLPWATRVLLGVSTFTLQYWYLVISAGVAVIVAFRMWVSDPAGRYTWDKLKLRTPVVGGIVRRASLAQICRSFALTLEAGVPMIQSLSTIARATGNEYLTERVFALRDGVERGEGLYRTAQTVDLFTPLALQMIAIGEETGALDEMLGEVAEFYEREVDYELENLSAAIEPILIVGVGGMVLVLALGVFLPLWDMAAKGTGLG